MTIVAMVRAALHAQDSVQRHGSVSIAHQNVPEGAKSSPRGDAGALFFEGVRALLDDDYRARLVKRRPPEPARGADHGIEKRPTTLEARDLVFLDDARERPTTDVDPGGVVAS